MRSQKLVTRRWHVGFIVGVCFLLTSMSAIAQERRHPPQFLFRDSDRLILVNGETGDWRQLPHIEATTWDHYEWSPNGQYLLAMQETREGGRSCLNIYRLDWLRWLYTTALSCDATRATFSHDSTQLAYSTFADQNAALRLHRFEDDAAVEVYTTSQGRVNYEAGIDHIVWSPTDTYVTFVSYVSIAGGTLNSLVVLNSESHVFYPISGGGYGYYAYYDPIWSPDDEWFLIQLKEEYVAGGATPFTNHRGDLYLIRAINGEQYRLTYTPAEEETNIGWTPDGNIQYDTVQHVILNIEDALNIPEPSPESVVTPEPIDYSDYGKCPDTYLAHNRQSEARVCEEQVSDDETLITLSIGHGGDLVYSITLSDFSPNTIIGWRP